MRSSFLLTCFLIFNLVSFSQQHKYASFSMQDGLPSNMVYRCLEDDDGFLWIATDAGIARFDGKRFQVFTTAHGLPDNEVLAVVKEKDGTVWVNCFKQGPAYFDKVQNRFIKAPTDSNSLKAPGTYISYMHTLEKGGVMYINTTSANIYKNRKPIPDRNYRPDFHFQVKENDDGSEIRLGFKNTSTNPRISHFKFIHQRLGKTIDSLIVGEQIDGFTPPAINDGFLYLFYGATNKCFVYKNFQTGPIRYTLDSLTVPSTIANYSFTATSIYLLCTSGKIYVFNKKTLRLVRVVEGDYLANSFLDDSQGNIWISTIDKGVLVYRKNQLRSLPIPSTFTHTNFISIARKTDGTIMAGNYYGEVIEAGDGKFKVHQLFQKLPSRQRKIIIAHNKIFTFSEDGIKINFKSPLTYKAAYHHITGKTAILYNDSIILAGLPSGLMKLNAITETATPLNTLLKRVTCIARLRDGMVYFGSTDGLYKYDLKKDLTIKILSEIPLLKERIATMCATPDDILWVGTASKGVIGIRDEKIIAYITASNSIINNSCRSIVPGKRGEIWLGTEQGISGIRYSLTSERMKFSARNLSMSDGLTSNAINEILFHSDTLYAATANGISVLPATMVAKPYEIPVRIINITIDQRDTAIYNKYHLPAGRKNIKLLFAAIELNGHFKNLEYSLDNHQTWIPLNDNALDLELNYGEHTLSVRAVDQNGNVSKDILEIEFHIATPYHKRAWFWILVALILQFLTVIIAVNWLKTRKRSRLAKQIAGVQNASLEQQAFTSLMNPHFMFNALNSVQHYINLQDRQNANRYLTDLASLIRKNFEAAQHSFIPLEQEIENIEIYLRLEQMRFAGRLQYEINIAEKVDMDQWMIPTMILQPLLENALLHGLMPSSISGKLTVEIKEIKNFLELSITDNGIGLKRSAAARELSGHKSRGTELIQKRIAALSHFAAQPVSIAMSPAFDNVRNPGNKVIILIPCELYPTWYKAHQRGMIPA
ncbi:MAG: hypothetical protein JWP69_690 [Flaviaesturariibacter sp.]|nr:hypothetical protein [Flaviaesturariibacter sp.]